MIKKYIPLLVVIANCFVVGACQKEYNPNSPSGGGYFGFNIEGNTYNEYRYHPNQPPMYVFCGINSNRDSLALYATINSPNINSILFRLPLDVLSKGNTSSITINPVDQCVLASAGRVDGIGEVGCMAIVHTLQITVSNFKEQSRQSFLGIKKTPVFAGTFEMTIELEEIGKGARKVNLTEGYFDVTIGDSGEYNECKSQIIYDQKIYYNNNIL